MDANTILTANLLDIIFEGKNKDYGAYDLRKSYNKRISVSLIITVVIISFLFIGTAIEKNFSPADLRTPETPDINLHQFPLPEPPPMPMLPPPPAPPVATIAFPPPLVVKDNQVTTPPPEIKDLLDARIDLKTSDGMKDIGIVTPPEEIKGSQVIAVPNEKKKDDSVFIRVEIEASFPGGADAWTKYVSKAIEKNLDEFSELDYGTCMIRFIVDKSGKVSQVEAITMKNTKLAEIAVNSIKNGPNWVPAQQNGRLVNAYRLQPVTLRNPGE